MVWWIGLAVPVVDWAIAGANKEMLQVFGLDTIPQQYFYISAAVVAVFIFAGRIAYLETPRVSLRFRAGTPFEIFDILPNGDKRRRYLLEVTNIGWQEIPRCSVKIIELTDKDNSFYAFAPIALRTEHEAVGEFHLSASETKMITFLSFIESRPEQQIAIHFAPTQERTPNALPPDRRYVITIGVFGAGTLVRRKFAFRVENGRLIICSKHEKQLRAFGWRFTASRCTSNGYW